MTTLAFLTYHIHDANDKVSAYYRDTYAGERHFNLPLEGWRKLETMLVVYGILALITHCMCNRERFHDEILLAFWLLVVLFFFEATPNDFSNTVFVPIMAALAVFVARVGS